MKRNTQPIEENEKMSSMNVRAILSSSKLSNDWKHKLSEQIRESKSSGTNIKNPTNITFDKKSIITTQKTIAGQTTVDEHSG